MFKITKFNLDLSEKINILLQNNNKISYNNQTLYSFKKFFGISFFKTLRLISVFGLNKYSKLKFLNKNLYNIIINFIGLKYKINKYVIFRFIYTKIKTKYKIKSYIGYRHLKNLPARGQRTHTNRNTQRSLKKFITLANIFETKLVVKEIEQKEKEERKLDIKKKYGKRNIKIKK